MPVKKDAIQGRVFASRAIPRAKQIQVLDPAHVLGHDGHGCSFVQALFFGNIQGLVLQPLPQGQYAASRPFGGVSAYCSRQGASVPQIKGASDRGKGQHFAALGLGSCLLVHCSPVFATVQQMFAGRQTSAAR